MLHQSKGWQRGNQNLSTCTRFTKFNVNALSCDFSVVPVLCIQTYSVQFRSCICIINETAMDAEPITQLVLYQVASLGISFLNSFGRESKLNAWVQQMPAPSWHSALGCCVSLMSALNWTAAGGESLYHLDLETMDALQAPDFQPSKCWAQLNPSPLKRDNSYHSCV